MKNDEQQIESELHYSLFNGATPVSPREPRIVQTDICFKSAPLQLNPRDTHDYIYRIWNNCVLNPWMELKMLVYFHFWYAV